MIPELTCPSCSYNLEGLVRTWTQCCPLTARCSECGSDLDLHETYRSLRNLPLWSFEHHPSARTFVQTTLMLPRPWRLWSGLTPNLRVHSGPLAIYVLLSLMLVHVCTAAISIAAQSLASPGGPDLLQHWPILLWPYFTEVELGSISIYPGLLLLLNVVLPLVTIPIAALAGWSMSLPGLQVSHANRSALLHLALSAWVYLVAFVLALGLGSVDASLVDPLVVLNVALTMCAMIVWWVCFSTCFVRPRHAIAFSLAIWFLSCSAIVLMAIALPTL